MAWACRVMMDSARSREFGLSVRSSLMARLGHSSIRAAMIYQHATRDRDRAIAQTLGALVREVRQEPTDTLGESRNAARLRRDSTRVWHVCGTGPGPERAKPLGPNPANRP